MPVDNFTWTDKNGNVHPHKTNIAIANGEACISPSRPQPHGGNLGLVKRVDENGNRHPRLCQGIRRGKPCGRWALKGVKYCQFCGGRRIQRNVSDCIGNFHGIFDVSKLRFYGKRLAPKMKAVIEELLDNPESETLRLDEELAIVRDIAGDAVALLSAAKELPDDNPKKTELRAAASAIAMDAMHQVRTFTHTAAAINSVSKDKFSVHALQDVVQQITKMVYLCFDHDKDGLALFDQMLTDQLRLPKIGVDGTNLTPDMDVTEMDSTIPSSDDEDLNSESQTAEEIPPLLEQQ